MDKALADTHGVRIQMRDYDAATFFRMRLHQARKIDRKKNEETYESGEPMHGASIYDRLICRIRTDDGGCWVYLEQMNASRLELEFLSEIEDKEFDRLPEPVKQKVIEASPEPLMIEHVKRRL